MNTPYEVLIRNGVAAHIIATDGAPAVAVTPEMWPEIGSAINAVTLGRLAMLEAELGATQADLDAEKAAFAAYKESAEAALKAAAEKIQDPNLDDTATVQAIAAIVAEKAKTVAARELEELDRQIEELTLKREALK